MNALTESFYDRPRVGLLLKRGLLGFIVILFFCDIAIYLSLAVSARIEPQYWIGLLVLFAGVLAWFSPHTRWQVLKEPVFLWGVLFLGLTVIFYFSVPGSHIEQFKERTRDVVLLTVFLGIFLMSWKQMSFIRKLVTVAVVLGVILNLISIVHNGFLVPPNVVWAYRPAGFYINPNESAIALILGMLLTVGVLSHRWRGVYCAFVLVGVAATFSREGVLGWLVATASLCIFRVVNWKRLGLYIGASVVCAGIGMVIAAEAHLINASDLSFYHYQIGRFTSLVLGEQLDASDAMRVKLAKAGWALFVTHPWIGNGIGSTYHWSLPASTHNMYLLYMDDYGVIGFFLYPLLIWCMIRGAVGETRRLAWTMAIFLLFWGLFDHNIVQNYYSLFAISLTAAMVWLSRKEPVLKPEPAPARAGSG